MFRQIKRWVNGPKRWSTISESERAQIIKESIKQPKKPKWNFLSPLLAIKNRSGIRVVPSSSPSMNSNSGGSSVGGIFAAAVFEERNAIFQENLRAAEMADDDKGGDIQE